MKRAARAFTAVGAFDHLVITAGPLVEAKPLAETAIQQAQADFNVKFWGSLRAVAARRRWHRRAPSP